MATPRNAVRNPLDAALRACRDHFWTAGLFSALVNILYLAPTLFMLQVYDRVVPTRGVETLVFLIFVFLFAVGTLTMLDYIRSRLLVRASARLDRILSSTIISALLSRAMSGGMRSSQAMREFDVLRQSMTGAGILALFDAPWTPIYILIAWMIHPALGSLALVGSATLLFLAVLNERSTKAPLQRANEAASLAYISVDHSSSAGGVIRALGMRRAMVERHMRERYVSIHLQAEASFASSTFMSITKFVRLSLQSLSLGLGAYLAIEQKISAGAIFAASLLITRSLSPIEQVLGAWKDVVKARGARRMLLDLFEQADKEIEHTSLPAPKGRLNIERVSVVSPARDRLILNDVSFWLAPGESLGIIGPSGAGKSTLVKAIAGAIPTQQGAVRFDGADAKDWDEEELARYVGYVPQEPSLFKGTVKENIARFRHYLGENQVEIDAAVVAAAVAGGAHDLILRLPKGYDTELDWNGSGLSAGQAQRIALARAFFGEPKIIIMDEPNAHLDSEGEADLLEAIGRFKQAGVTVIIVAHRTGILAGAEKLLVLRDGRVDIMGTREEVTQRLASAQAANQPAVQAKAAAAKAATTAPAES